jgi:predicted MFS family arabinose efflux permease
MAHAMALHHDALLASAEGVEHHGAERARRGGVGRQPGPLRERVVNWPMLRSRALRTLLVAAAASNLGDGVTVAAAPLLAASLTEDPRRIGAVGVALTLPWLLFALPSGAVADRADRRWLMVAADLARTACMGLLALAVLTGQASIPILLVVFFATTTADTVFHNASQAALPMVVDRDGLPRANARFQTVQIVGATLVGPALGGLLFAAAAAAPFALDAVSFAVSAALLATLPGRLRSERAEAPSTIRADIVEGARWLLGHRVLRTICWVLTLENIAEVAGYVMLVLLAREGLGLDARGYGLLLASSAAGGLLGAAVTERLHRQAGDAGSLVGATVAMAGARALLAATTSPAVAGLALALYGFAAVWWNIVTASFRQAVVPERLQGRVNSAYRLASWGPARWGRPPAGWSPPRSACAPSTPAPRSWSDCWR